jgi:hypothetical protein
VQINEGQVFTRKETKLPPQLRPCAKAIDACWLTLSDNASKLKEQVSEAGWHLFRLEEQVRGWSIGRGREEASRKALRKAMRKIAGPRNGAEIVSIQYKAFCGFYLCRIQLAVRHIQREMILHLTPAVGLISAAVKPENWLGHPYKEPQELASA